MIFFDVAAHWHKIYALHLEMRTAYGADDVPAPESVCADENCYLGRWIHGRGQQFAALPDFIALRLQHAAFHAIACEMVNAFKQGDLAAGQQIKATRFRTTSAAVIAALDVLSAEIDRLEAGQRPLQPSSDPVGEFCPINAIKIGVPELDGQHASLAALARLLMANPLSKLSGDQIPELLVELTSLVALHFDTEELYMRHAGMPAGQLAQHVAAHRTILEGFRQISTGADKVELISVSDILPKVGRWFLDHLLDYDYGIKPLVSGANGETTAS